MLLLALPLMLGVRLSWFEGRARVAASELDSEITSSITETPFPLSKGVSSSGVVGIVAVMVFHLVGWNYREESEESGREEDVEEERWGFSTRSDSTP